jgi:NAD+ synthase (glutamine-hydrolysing)
MVYELVKYRNLISYAKCGEYVIPREILDKPPSAELRANQKDTDSLPPYDFLDPILKLLVEERMLAEEIVASGFCEKLGISDETVRRVAKLVHGSEFKRHQTSIGSKVTPLASGGDRRMPIVNKFEG